MKHGAQKTRVLYSFALKMGGGRVGCTSWQQVKSVAEAGAQILAFPGVLQTPLPPGIAVRPTLSRGKIRVPYKISGTLRACAIHDWIVARRLEELNGQIDIVHTWPLASLRTLATAARLGIPAVYERPNAHTRFFYEAVRDECSQIGLTLGPNHEHNWNDEVLRLEEEEYRRATRILCPSRHVAETFQQRGFTPEKLARHHYGYDPTEFFPEPVSRPANEPLTMLFAGGLSPVKGLHYALQAWVKSSACRKGSFLLAGEPTAQYMAMLRPFLNHPSVQVLGHRNDVNELMRKSDVLVLPSISEGFALVCAEAIGSGCIPLVSDRVTEMCKHMQNSLVHGLGDVETLAQHISMLDGNRDLLKRLRAGCLATSPEMTWRAAGIQLLKVYDEVIAAHQRRTLIAAASSANSYQWQSRAV